MHANANALTILTAFNGVTLGLSPPLEERGMLSSTLCYTTMNTRQGPCRTKWSTKYTPCAKTATSTRTATNTLSLPTTTITSTTIVTASTSTLTESSTSTTVTTTTETDSQRSPAPRRYQQAQYQLRMDLYQFRRPFPGSSNSGSGGAVMKRDGIEGANSKRVSFSANNGRNGRMLGPSKKRYPHNVNCNKWQPGRCSTTTEVVTTTKTYQPAGTVTSTTTLTSTVYPSATTTTTSITTSTVTTTTTTISTTASDTTATATSYAICAANNLADNVLGTIIGNTGPVDSNQLSDVLSLAATSAQDCCEKSYLASGNTATFLNARALGSANCYYAIPQTCSSGQNSLPYKAYLGDQDFGTVTVGNLGCGIINMIN